MGKLALASFNTFGISGPFNLFQRYKIIAEYFNNHEVDVINFQEVLTYFHLVLFKIFLRKYPFVQFSPSLIGPKGGLVTFSKYPLQKINYLSYSKKHIPIERVIFELIFQKGI